MVASMDIVSRMGKVTVAIDKGISFVLEINANLQKEEAKIKKR
jgi:hypothetical protein